MMENPLHDDLLIGAAAIADFIYGSTEYKYQRRVYYLTTQSKRRLPWFRLGSQIAARRSSIMTWIEAQEGWR
ncbi:MAG: DNA-binding protein [Hoeflea sp. D1-CHI-28]